MNNVTRITAVLAIAALALTASAAGAFTLRSPQVVFASSTLQGDLTAWDGGIIAATQQLDAQAFSTGLTGNTDFTLLLKSSPNAAIGVYNVLGGATPPLYQLFAPATPVDYYVSCHFASGGNLAVTLFDNNGVAQGTTNFTGVDRTNFGFYISTASVPPSAPAGVNSPVYTWYSQDSRNGGSAQALTYQGTDGVNTGEWFECFEANPYSPASMFTSAVLVLQSVNPLPTPTRQGSWGALKASYR